MIERGDAYMIMENIVAANPQNNFLARSWRAKRDTKATAEKTAITHAKSPRILAFSFLGEKMMKIST